MGLHTYEKANRQKNPLYISLTMGDWIPLALVLSHHCLFGFPHFRFYFYPSHPTPNTYLNTHFVLLFNKSLSVYLVLSKGAFIIYWLPWLVLCESQFYCCCLSVNFPGHSAGLSTSLRLANHWKVRSCSQLCYFHSGSCLPTQHQAMWEWLIAFGQVRIFGESLQVGSKSGPVFTCLTLCIHNVILDRPDPLGQAGPWWGLRGIE